MQLEGARLRLQPFPTFDDLAIEFYTPELVVTHHATESTSRSSQRPSY